MSREELILAALSSAAGSPFSPVQIQKLLFLIDRRIGREIGGPYFDFVPYHYGPFDKGIYALLDRLVKEGLMEANAVRGLKWNLYKPTLSGQIIGDQILSGIREKPRSYMAKLVSYVVQLSFDDLVSAIYRAYPEMDVNSIFKVER